MNPFLPILALVAALAWTGAQDPADAPAKAKVTSALDATGLHYAPSPSGMSLSCLFDHPGGRRQTVWVAVKPNRVGSLVTHSIYTTVWTGKIAPEGATIRQVVTQNKKFGAFYLICDDKGRWAIRFGVQFDATELPERSAAGDAAVKTLREMIEFVNTVGEEADQQLNGKVDVR